LAIVGRAHSDAEIEHLKKHRATVVIMTEHEIAKAMIDNVTRQFKEYGDENSG
jgi:CPA2 family monovalent cation:H+ antiporter-2